MKATVALWSIAVVVVVGLAVWRAVPKRAEAASARCYARIQAFGALTKAYAGKHGGQRPTSLDDLRRLVANMTPDACVCPSDRRPMNGWESVTSADASYQFCSSSAVPAAGNSELVRCAIHGHVVYHNGKTRRADN